MARNVTLTVSTTNTLPLDGQVAGNWAYKFFDSANNLISEADTTETTHTFADVPAGSYVFSAARLDTKGILIGTIATAKFDVVDLPIIVPVQTAGSLSITLG